MTTRRPDFENNLLQVLRGQTPERPTLFEMIISTDHLVHMAGRFPAPNDGMDAFRMQVEAMENGGYDYVMAYAAPFLFRADRRVSEKTHSLNGQGVISDWESFERYPWPDAVGADYSGLKLAGSLLPEGMKLGVLGPNGVLENVIDLVGYDNLCFMLFEEPELAQAIFDKVGSTLLTYYEHAAEEDSVGFLCSNDDWGFNTQTFLSPELMRRYVFPWHKKIVQTAHAAGKPCMLHSCGYFDNVIEDIIGDIGYDARHSYEDGIKPVEEAYEQLQGRIAVLGGIDIHFLATRTPDEIYRRCRDMLARTADRGGYALGSGNSIPGYIPFENFDAMRRAALDRNF